MKITPMGENRAENEDDILQCLDEAGLTVDMVEAIVASDPFDPDAVGPSGVNMTGSSATLSSNEDGEEVCQTVGFEDRQTLIAMLEGVGVAFSDVD